MSWRCLLGSVAGRPGFVPEAKIFFISFLSKYLPGRVWSVLAQVDIGRRAGLGTGQVMTVFLLSLVVGLITGGTVGLVVAPAVLGPQAVWLLALVSLVVVGYVRPDLGYRACAWAARRVRRPLPDRAPDPRATRRALTISLASWVLGGLHLWLIAVLLGADPARAARVRAGSRSPPPRACS
ncbi:lysylphosphatidylglycerol synthase domain-containing protein [Luedemannella flava]